MEKNKKPSCEGGCSKACPKNNKGTLLEIIDTIEDLQDRGKRETLDKEGITICPECIEEVLNEVKGQIPEIEEES